MSEYTPTTEDVAFYFVGEFDPQPRQEAFDRWLAEVERAAAEKAWNQAVGRALEITQTEYLIGDGLLTVIGNPYAAEAYRGEKNK